MEAAKQGEFTPQMAQALATESISKERLLQGVANGRIVIPANKNHTNLVAGAIGEGLRTKVNVNLGVSQDCCNLDMELRKVKDAVALNADAIMDLSTFGDT
jgi:phosphomethylpyrimidine synthase